jgi:predicted transcriptional regulator
MRTVNQLLETKPAIFNRTEPDTLVINALNMLSTLNISYLVVMNNDEYKGIFSERDYCRNVILKGLTSSNARVEEVMTTDFPIVSTTDTVEHCMRQMDNYKTRYLLAFDDETFAGVVTIHDLLRQVLFNKQQVFDETLTYNLIASEEGSVIY